MNLNAVMGSIKSPRTPLALKKGLIKKYAKQLGLTKSEQDKYLKASGKAGKGKGKSKGKGKASKKNPPMQGWDIFEGGKKVDTVFFDSSFDRDDVLNALEHDGYYGVTIKKTARATSQYVVTALDKNKGWRVTVTKPMIKAKAEAQKKRLQADMKVASASNKWASAVKVEKASKGNPKPKKNPATSSNGTLIYDRITAIEAIKGKGSLWPDEPFRHDFKKGGKIFGLPNGDLLVKKDAGDKKLWKNFMYGPEDGTRGKRSNPAKSKKLYGVFSGKKFGLTWSLKDARDYVKKYGGEIRYVMDRSGSPLSWDAPTFRVSSTLVDGKNKNPKRIISPRAKLSGPRKSKNVPKYYIGAKGRKGEILKLKNMPTKASHGHRFTKMHGPFDTKKACMAHAKTL